MADELMEEATSRAEVMEYLNRKDELFERFDAIAAELEYIPKQVERRRAIVQNPMHVTPVELTMTLRHLTTTVLEMQKQIEAIGTLQEDLVDLIMSTDAETIDKAQDFLQNNLQ